MVEYIIGVTIGWGIGSTMLQGDTFREEPKDNGPDAAKRAALRQAVRVAESLAQHVENFGVVVWCGNTIVYETKRDKYAAFKADPLPND